MFGQFCKSFGITMEEMLASTESPANFSYSQYILDVGHRGDVLELVVAVLSCLVGYGEVGLYLRRKIAEGSEGFILEGNRYRRWIEDYSGADYQGAVTRGIGTSILGPSHSSDGCMLRSISL
jgi:hydroxymethylpyrimidine/phosphomethylpyrimidine kinase